MTIEIPLTETELIVYSALAVYSLLNIFIAGHFSHSLEWEWSWRALLWNTVGTIFFLIFGFLVVFISYLYGWLKSFFHWSNKFHQLSFFWHWHWHRDSYRDLHDEQLRGHANVLKNHFYKKNNYVHWLRRKCTYMVFDLNGYDPKLAKNKHNEDIEPVIIELK